MESCLGAYMLKEKARLRKFVEQFPEVGSIHPRLISTCKPVLWKLIPHRFPLIEENVRVHI